MLRRLLLTSLLCLAGWTNVSNADLLEVCTFPQCGPDFGFGGDATYVYDGNTDTGILTIVENNSIGSVSFLPGQLDSTWESTYVNSDIQSRFTDFNLTLTVDGNGNIVAGSNSITLSGNVFKFVGGVGPVTAISANGTDIDGALISGGGITQLGSAGGSLDFIGFINSSSVLTIAGYGAGVVGDFTINDGSGTVVAWDQSWSASGTLDVAVPVPAAAWLFGSGLIALFGAARTKRQNA